MYFRQNKNLSSHIWDERHSSAVPPEFGACAPHSNAVRGVPAGDWPELTGEPSTGSARRFQPPTSLSAPDRGVLFSRSKPYNMYNSNIYSTKPRKLQVRKRFSEWSVESGEWSCGVGLRRRIGSPPTDLALLGHLPLEGEASALAHPLGAPSGGAGSPKG